MNRRIKGNLAAVPIGSVQIHTGDYYVVNDRLDAGGSGVVYRAHHEHEPALDAVVKFYLIPKQAKLFGTTAQAVWGAEEDEQVYKNERTALMELQHPGIQRVLGWGALDNAHQYFANEADFDLPPSDKVGFVVSRYVDGPSIRAWIEELGREATTSTAQSRFEVRTRIIRVLTDLLESLTYLHETKHYQHSDIRAENIIIDRTSLQPILIDFGFAQVFAEELIKSTPTTRVRPLRLLNAPPRLESELEGLWNKGTAEVSRELLRQKLFPALDLYQFGRLLESLIASLWFNRLVTPLDADFLGLLTQDLVDWDAVRGLKTSDVLGQIEKLVDGYWSGAAAPHAPQLAPGQPVRRIGLSSSTFLAPPLVKDIIETRSFRRLQQLKQLSLLDFVFPGATQTRLDHSLAVYSTAVELVEFLVRSPRFTKIFDTNSVTELLMCALLHDVNHFPFLHYFQELKLAGAEKRNLFKYFIEVVGTSTTGGASHTIAEVLADAGIDPQRVIHVLTANHGELADPSHQIIKSILDSGVDIDKLCYVQGDARSTGVPFGAGVDRRTLLASADVLRQSGGDEHWHVCFEPSALSAVESLLLARYWNFKQVYWHHTNRALGAMVTHVLRALTEAGSLDIHTYINATMSLTEAGAMAYLDNLYEEKFGRPSILRDLVTRRAGLFKRLLSIRSPWTGGSRSAEEKRRYDLVEALRDLRDTERVGVISLFKDQLYRLFPGLSGIVPKDELLVLLDIPGRPLDQEMGEVFVTQVQLTGAPGDLVNSPFVDILKTEFLNLSRTVRLFIPALVRDGLGKSTIRAAQVELEKRLAIAIREFKSEEPNTVR